MQFEVQCKSCHRKFAIEALEGETLSCQCPYCHTQMMVATPMEEPVVGPVASKEASPAKGTDKAESIFAHEVKTKKPLSASSFGVRITLIFFIVVLVSLVVATLLYIIFSTISK